ncbi:MAG: NAD-dependent protein deacylase [Firmicutes bacterium]|nr:NAD-dependent protein deacylase [Bacillota bacterium]
MDERLKKLIDNSDNIVFFGGAGVSTESNIPDFRSENGLYSAISEYGVSPEEILSHSFFMNKTKTFYDYYWKHIIYREAQPNRAHRALAKLEKMGKLKAVITQNIDGLHQMAGSKKVYELHGSTLRYNCMKCGQFYDLDFAADPAHQADGIPRCPVCGGIIKPDVVLYEEPLDGDQIDGAVSAIAAADLLIVGGTSLVVYPAAGFIRYFRGRNMVLINKQPTAYDSQADLVIHDSIGKVMDMDEE